MNTACQASALRCRPATAADVGALLALVNGAYRGDSSRQGWTTEADLLDGTRTDAEELVALVADPASLLLLCEDDAGLLGSAHLKVRDDGVYLGMFTVRPDCQGRGIGKAFLHEVELAARVRLGAKRLRMEVISRRSELLAFYQRRGYRDTGLTHAFPTALRYGIPKVPELSLLVLEKPLTD